MSFMDNDVSGARFERVNIAGVEFRACDVVDT
jgi:hypothetical protein